MGTQGFYRGTSHDQVPFFANKEKKMIESRRWPAEFEQEVDMSKVNIEAVTAWITKRITELLGLEDDIVIDYCKQQLINASTGTRDCSTTEKVCPKRLQINLTGFLAKNASRFVKELWNLLLNAQESSTGIPDKLLEEKQNELEKKEKEAEKVMAALQLQKESNYNRNIRSNSSTTRNRRKRIRNHSLSRSPESTSRRSSSASSSSSSSSTTLRYSPSSSSSTVSRRRSRRKHSPIRRRPISRSPRRRRDFRNYRRSPSASPGRKPWYARGRFPRRQKSPIGRIDYRKRYRTRLSQEPDLRRQIKTPPKKTSLSPDKGYAGRCYMDRVDKFSDSQGIRLRTTDHRKIENIKSASPDRSLSRRREHSRSNCSDVERALKEKARTILNKNDN